MLNLKLFANWLLRAACYLVIILSLVHTVARAQSAGPVATVSSDSLIGWLGTLGAILVGIWSRSQERRIESNREAAAAAMVEARRVNDMVLTGFRPREDHDRILGEIKQEIRELDAKIERVLFGRSGEHHVLRTDK